jgi:hypothetical protein
MGLFDLFRKKKGEPPPPEPPPPDEPEPPPDAVVVVREGMSVPSEDDIRSVVASLAPDAMDAARRGLSQPRWWQKEEWVASGCRSIATALAAELGIDPDKTSWRIGRDDRGARVAVVILRK